MSHWMRKQKKLATVVHIKIILLEDKQIERMNSSVFFPRCLPQSVLGSKLGAGLYPSPLYKWEKPFPIPGSALTGSYSQDSEQEIQPSSSNIGYKHANH